MSTARFCIKHRVTTLLAVIMIAVFGVVFTTQLQMSLLPDVEAPMAVVVCYYNGATPSDMEELVTRPLETAVMSVPGVDFSYSGVVLLQQIQSTIISLELHRVIRDLVYREYIDPYSCLYTPSMPWNI